LSRRLSRLGWVALPLVACCLGVIVSKVTHPPARSHLAPQPRPRKAASFELTSATPAAPRVVLADSSRGRPPGEWQGMPVSPDDNATCSASARCGLALACLDGRCGPCQRDDECATGEGCVLQYCLRLENIGCRLRKDCTVGALCELTGLTSDPRNNATMRAICRAASGGAEAPPPELVVGLPTSPPEVQLDDLMAMARAALADGGTR
jgi:hypothetical protein